MTKRKMSQSNDARNRNWTFLVYQDSAPENWREILRDEMKLLFIVSPFHEFDINEDGTAKKPHWHVVLCFEGNKSKVQIQDISNQISGVLVQPVNNMKGMIQYLIHKNNPEKYQYKREDIESYGIDIEDYFGLTPSQMQAKAEEIIDFIMDNDISEFSDLVEKAKIIDREWLYVLMNRNTQFFKAYLYNKAMIKREVASK